MEDLNNMSMEDLIRFAEKGVLPDNIKVDVPSSDDDIDMNALSPAQLLAMAEGKAPDVSENNASSEESVGEESEASAEDLMALLGDTIGDDEFEGSGNEEKLQIGKAIEKLKLRQLANKIEAMAPAKLFPPRKDEIYYFLTSMLGQTNKIRIEEADKKCGFIGQALKDLETYMISDIGLSLDETDVIISTFKQFAKDTVSETE